MRGLLTLVDAIAWWLRRAIRRRESPTKPPEIRMDAKFLRSLEEGRQSMTAVQWERYFRGIQGNGCYVLECEGLVCDVESRGSDAYTVFLFYVRVGGAYYWPC